MKKLITLILALSFVFMLAACGAASASAADHADDGFTVGICQLVQHPALDAATQGFKEALTAKLGDKVTFNEQNASGDSATCAIICNQFVSDEVDLILANATPALLAAQAATNQIPILGTSVTDYASALDFDEEDWTGATGTNISGTSDGVPAEEYAKLLNELFPDAKNVGILYCSGEPNSKFQADQIRPFLEEMGYTVADYTFADSNDVAAVTNNACDDCDVLYIPTDNTAASCAEAIHNVVLKRRSLSSPVRRTSAPAAAWRRSPSPTTISACHRPDGRRDPGNGERRRSRCRSSTPQFAKEFNETNCEILGIEVPEDFYVAIGRNERRLSGFTKPCARGPAGSAGEGHETLKEIFICEYCCLFLVPEPA